jgi:hypothetical protein
MIENENAGREIRMNKKRTKESSEKDDNFWCIYIYIDMNVNYRTCNLDLTCFHIRHKSNHHSSFVHK